MDEYEMQCFWKESLLQKTIRMLSNQISENIRQRDKIHEENYRNHLLEMNRIKNGESIYFQGFISKLIKHGKD